MRLFQALRLVRSQQPGLRHIPCRAARFAGDVGLGQTEVAAGMDVKPFEGATLPPGRDRGPDIGGDALAARGGKAGVGKGGGHGHVFRIREETGRVYFDD